MSDRGFLLDVSDVAVEDRDSVSSGFASLVVLISDSEERGKARVFVRFRHLFDRW